jgi:Tfp pilus assembly PilM family ATPase/Tfp pilus assembly protein PilN
MFKLLPFFQEKYDTYVQIDRKHLKIMQIIYRGKEPAIKKLIAKPIIGMDEKSVAGFLKEIANANSIPLNFVTIIISREKAMVRHMRLPAVDKQEIDSMVSFEITKQTPYSREEIVADSKVLKSDEQGYSNVMLVVSPKTEIVKIHDIVRFAGGNPRRIVLSSEAMAGWFSVSGKHFSKTDSKCIVNIDYDNTEIMIISDKGLESSRAVSIGASELQQGVNDMNSIWSKLVDEIKRSVSTYQKENQLKQESTSEFIVTGASSVMESFNRFLTTAVTNKCIFLPVFSSVVLLDGALDASGMPEDVSVCAICGAAYLDEPINLMPEEYKMRYNYQSKFRKATTILTALAVAFIMFFSILGIRIYQKQQLLKQIESLYSQIQPIVEQTEEKIHRLRIVKNHLSDGELSLEVIYNLYELIPSGISLVDFNYDDLTKTVRFNGRAGRMSDVFKLVTTLEESDAFSNVQTHSVIQRQARDGTTVDFQIRCSFNIKD